MANITRSITVYSATESEDLLAELILPKLNLDILTGIISPSENDPNLYICYKLSHKQLLEIFSFIPSHYNSILILNLDIYEYYLETVSSNGDIG